MSKRATEREYVELARIVCETLGIDASSSESFESLMQLLRNYGRLPYGTSTQERALGTLRRIVAGMDNRKDVRSIRKDIARLKSAVLFDKFD
jgi:hypothetical protein